MNENLISVIIPAYNREDTIERAVRSILDQTYSNLEVIVVDDCSKDGTVEVLKSIADKRLKYYILEKNSGACVARNYGVEHAAGEIIAFQDSDDYWHPNKLEKQLEYLKSNDLEFVTCGFTRYRGEESQMLGLVECPKDRVNLWCELLNHNWVSTQTIVCYRYCFNKICFDPEITRYQDWDLALQAANYFKMGVLNESLVEVYLQENSITNVVKNDGAMLKVIQKHYDDMDKNNNYMLAQYYKSIADVKRRSACFEASTYYWKSFIKRPKIKTFICWAMCLTGIMRFYRTRQ